MEVIKAINKHTLYTLEGGVSIGEGRCPDFAILQKGTPIFHQSLGKGHPDFTNPCRVAPRL